MNIEMLKALNANEFVIFDTETTALGAALAYGKIIEIGAVKVRDGQIVDTFSEFINPEMKIPKKIVELTHITDDDVKDADTIFPVLFRFRAFCGNAVLVAHNALFDTKFINFWLQQKCIPLTTHNVVIDTLVLDKELFPTAPNHKLATIAERFGIAQVAAHRAVDDARVTAEAFLKMRELLHDASCNYSYTYNCCSKKIDVAKLKYRRFGDFIKPGDGKKKGDINRLYINIYYPDDAVYGSIYYDRIKKEWFNKDFPCDYEIDFKEVEKTVLALKGGIL